MAAQLVTHKDRDSLICLCNGKLRTPRRPTLDRVCREHWQEPIKFLLPVPHQKWFQISSHPSLEVEFTINPASSLLINLCSLVIDTPQGGQTNARYLQYR